MSQTLEKYHWKEAVETYSGTVGEVL